MTPIEIIKLLLVSKAANVLVKNCQANYNTVIWIDKFVLKSKDLLQSYFEWFLARTQDLLKARNKDFEFSDVLVLPIQGIHMDLHRLTLVAYNEERFNQIVELIVQYFDEI